MKSQVLINEELSTEEVALYAAVPVDGSTIGNQRAQQRLKWADEKYWRVRDSLVDKDLIARGRGRGGTLRRVIESIRTEVVSVPVDIENSNDQVAYAEAVVRREEELYQPLADV